MSGWDKIGDEIAHSLYTDGPATRAELADRLDMARTTLSPTVGQLLESGRIVSHLEQSGDRGRPHQVLSIDPDQAWIIGIDLSGSGWLVIHNPADATITSVPLKINERTIWDKFVAATKALREFLELHDSELHLKGIGLALPVPMYADAREDKATAALIEKMTGSIAQKFHTTAFVDNSVRLMALGELTRGLRIKDGFFISVDHGIGHVQVSDGAIVHGQNGLAGEIGHVFAGGDTQCKCGQTGCLETVASVPALLRLSGADNIDELDAKFRAGDAKTVTAIDNAVTALTSLITCFHTALDPGVIILGGSLFHHLPYLLRRIQAQTEGRLLYPDNFSLRLAALGLSARAEGAAFLASRSN